MTAESAPGEWLERECKALGVTLHHVAREAKLSPSTVHRWAHGKTAPYWLGFERVRGVLEDIRAKRRERDASFWERREGA